MKAKSLQEWSILVLERDSYVCMDCGATGCRLHAHHIKEKRKYPALALEIDNGKTLCIPCHIKYHPFMARFYGINPDIASEFVGVYKRGTVARVDLDRYYSLVYRAANELMNMLKRREKKRKKYKHGMSIGNWWMKQQGYRKDIRRDAWNVLLEAGLLLQHKESVWLFATIAKLVPKKRIKIAPAPIIQEFKKRAQEHYEFLALEKEPSKIRKPVTEEVQKVAESTRKIVEHPSFGSGKIINEFEDKVRLRFEDGQERIFNLEKLKELAVFKWEV